MKVDGKTLTESERMEFLISIEREPPDADSYDYVSGIKPRPLPEDIEPQEGNHERSEHRD